MTNPPGAMPPLPEIERLAVEHEAFGFGRVDAQGLTTHGFDPEGLHAFTQAVAAPLIARVAELQADAARYRWLRDSAMLGTKHDPAVLIDGPSDCCEFAFGLDLDAAVDAARLKGNQA